MHSPPPGLSASDLSKSFKSRTIFSDLDLSVEPGAVTFVIGPNGAGKTTLFDILTGETTPDTGTVTFGGRPIQSWPFEAFRFVQQSAGLLQDLTAGETVKLWWSLWDEAGDDTLLDQVGLRHVEKTLVRNLSGGEQQRLRLALSTIGRADLVVYDEPTNNLDADARSMVCDLLRRNASAGAAVLVSTHDIELLAEVPGSVHMLLDGSMHQVRSPEAATRAMVVGDHFVSVDDFASLEQLFEYGRSGR